MDYGEDYKAGVRRLVLNLELGIGDAEHSRKAEYKREADG